VKLTLIGKEKEARDVVSFIFKPEAPLAWVAGQFLHYKLPHPDPDERKDERWFTISAPPFEGNVVVTTRISENGSSFKKALNALPAGGTIEASGPDGDFIIEDPKGAAQGMPFDVASLDSARDRQGREFVFIAGGMGITPFRAMLLDLDKRGVAINAKLLYANRDGNFVFRDKLEALAGKHKNLTIRYFVTPERIDEATVASEAPDITKPVFYVSGPEPMVEQFEKMLSGLGVPEPHLKRDYFPGYTWP